MRRRTVVLLAALVVGTGLAVAVQAPAFASLSQCPSDYVCLWQGTDYTTLLGSPLYRSPGTCYNMPTNINDTAGSFYNHLSNGHSVQFYSNANCSGFLIHRYANGSGGPHAPGVHDKFIVLERDDLSSVWFNNG